MEKIRRQIVDLIKRSENILLMPSAPVDGDSLGSALAMYLVLKKIGKEATVVCADPVPDAFLFLPTTKVISDDFTAAGDFIVTLDCRKSKLKTIKTKLEQDKVNIIITAKKGRFTAEDVSFDHGPHRYDLIITVDTGDLEQLGRFYEDNPAIFTDIPLINIDHHASNSNFGRINYVDIMSSATTELLIPLIADMEKEYDKNLMDGDVATLLLAGIITDTGSFQNANTTPKSFANSAHLIRHGARQQEIIQHVFKTKNLSQLKLWGRILTKMKVDEKHKIVWSTIGQNDFKDTGSTDDETGGIIDELMSNAPGTEIILLLKQKESNLISGSLRTTTAAVDASAIAEMFGGGGHVQAAGFKIEGDDIGKVETEVVEKIRKFQEKRLSAKPEEPAYTTEITPDAGEEVLKETPLTGKTRDFVTEEIKPKTDETDTRTAKETFTDFVIKTGSRDDDETEIHPDVVYKFED